MLSNTKIGAGKLKGMKKKACEICGYTGKPEELVTHQIVPEEIASQTGIVEVRQAVLCINCSYQAQTWCDKKVSSVSYDDEARHFVPKSPAEMIKEYEAAYEAFAAYKKRLHTKT